jgi:hypothetical protein
MDGKSGGNPGFSLFQGAIFHLNGRMGLLSKEGCNFSWETAGDSGAVQGYQI